MLSCFSAETQWTFDRWIFHSESGLMFMCVCVSANVERLSCFVDKFIVNPSKSSLKTRSISLLQHSFITHRHAYCSLQMLRQRQIVCFHCKDKSRLLSSQTHWLFAQCASRIGAPRELTRNFIMSNTNKTQIIENEERLILRQIFCSHHERCKHTERETHQSEMAARTKYAPPSKWFHFLCH